MNTYKLKKVYPGLPKDWEIGIEVGLGCRTYGYSPCNGKYTNWYINNDIIENNPEFWEKVVEKDYEVLSYNIIKFEIINNELKIFQEQHINSSKYKPLLIQDLIKVKQPLFKTEDGKEIYEGDNTFGIDEKYQFLKFNGWVWKKNESPNKLHKHFSTKEKAEEYIIMNKPCLSINDVLSVGQRVIVDEGKLKQIVKSKI